MDCSTFGIDSLIRQIRLFAVLVDRNEGKPSMNKRSFWKPWGLCIALAVSLIAPIPAQADLVLKSKFNDATTFPTSWYQQTIPSCFRSSANITLYAFDDHDMDRYLRSVGLASGASCSKDGDLEIDGLFDNRRTSIFVRVSDQGAFNNQALTHEYGHYVWFRLFSKKDRGKYRKIYNGQRHNHFLISDYSYTNLEEGFAEAFAFYVISPNLLQQKDAASYAFLSQWQDKHSAAQINNIAERESR
jgi:hypothetical protein